MGYLGVGVTAPSCGACGGSGEESKRMQHSAQDVRLLLHWVLATHEEYDSKDPLLDDEQIVLFQGRKIILE